jgi:DNA mismatch repair protein MutL
MPIRRLSQSLINKIAAGEVIERPASVVKELMENAVDAGAKRIDVAIGNGGLDMIRVVDSGSGISAEELPLAVAPHATSKLSDADDLFRVGTLGFRGEALASISEVSRMVLRSRPQSQDANSHGGAELEIVGGIFGEVAPCGCPVGTTIEVHNLFYNTPVRRKFLRTPQTEFGHISEAFTRIALAQPGIHFTLKHNERQVMELPAAASMTDRIAGIFGRELADQLIYVESADGDVRISGCVAHPGQSRSNNRSQYLFLNGRHIRDHALQHALGEAYRGLLMVGRFAIGFLSISMPPDMVDVNVHPTKLEVRFRDGGRLYSQLLSTLRSKFLTTDLTTYGQSPAVGEAADNTATIGQDEAQAARARQELVDWAKSKLAAIAPAIAMGGDGAVATAKLQQHELPGLHDSSRGTLPGAAPGPLELTRIGVAASLPSGLVLHTAHATASASAAGSIAQGESTETSSVSIAAQATDGHSPTALQIHNRYLITESAEGVTIIDQHALHERILFEQLRSRIDAGALETQSLLVPEPVDLSPAEAALAMENRDILAELGLRIEPFGGSTLLVTGFPAMLANMNPAELLRTLLERLVTGGGKPDRRDLLDDLLHSVACKAAIKAGDRLNPAEITALLEQRHLVDDAHHCPHGRPTALVFTREELDKQFKRT